MKTTASKGRTQRLRAHFAPQRESIVTVLLVVALVDALFTLDATARGFGPKLSDIPAEALIYLTLCIISYGLYLTIQAVSGLQLTARLLIIFAACVVCGILHEPIINLIMREMTDYPVSTWTPTLRNIHTRTTIYLFTAAALLAVDYHRAVREREGQLARSRVLAEEAERLALRYEINPHFLFNALNSVSSLVLDHKNQAAEDMLLRLSVFFRQTLETANARMISLGQEIELQEAYLDVEQARFGDDVTAEIDVPAPLLEAQVPPLILQPLVDNAVKYGAPWGGATAVISIRATADKGLLVLEVINSVSGLDRPGTGTGLKNVRERLASHFGAAATLTTDTSDPKLHKARLTMPLVFEAPDTTPPETVPA